MTKAIIVVSEALGNFLVTKAMVCFTSLQSHRQFGASIAIGNCQEWVQLDESKVGHNLPAAQNPFTGRTRPVGRMSEVGIFFK